MAPDHRVANQELSEALALFERMTRRESVNRQTSAVLLNGCSHCGGDFDYRVVTAVVDCFAKECSGTHIDNCVNRQPC